MRFHVSTNADILVGRYRNRIQKLTPAIRRAENRTMDEARRKAIEYSTNRAYKVTGKPPFPYSRKNPQPPIPAFRINIQGRKGSEHFRDKWFVNVQETPTGYTSSIWNSAKYAKYMRGTVKMIERPILSKVAEDVRSFRLTVEHDEIVKVMQSG